MVRSRAKNNISVSSTRQVLRYLVRWPAKGTFVQTQSPCVSVGLLLLFFVAHWQKQRSARARKVYLETKQSVWVQAVTVFSVGFVLVAVILARWLTSAGRNTPIIAWTFQVSPPDQAGSSNLAF